MSAGKQLAGIALFAVLVACVPLVTTSGVTLNFVMMALLRHADRAGLEHPRWLRWPVLVRPCAVLRHRRLHPGDRATAGRHQCLGRAAAGHRRCGAGRPVHRRAERSATGLKGSYFALVTLAFAEVFRILALSARLHGRRRRADGAAARGGRQPAVRHARGYLWVVLAMVCWRCCVTCWLRNGRFGAYLQAVRDNEDAARAVGVNPFRVKLGGHRPVGRLHGRGRCLLRAGVPVHRCRHRLRRGRVGRGAGGGHRRRHGHRVGPVLGAVVLHALVDLTRNLFGELPGINMVIYGTVLDADRDLRAARHRRHRPVGAAARGARRARRDGTTLPAGAASRASRVPSAGPQGACRT